MPHTAPPANTLTLGGRIEARLADADALLPAFHHWIAQTQAAGFPFHVEQGPDRLTLLPDTAPLPCHPDTPAHDNLAAHLRQLIDLIPAADRPSLTCTLRSEQVHPSQLLQAIYRLDPPDSLSVETRTVSADTAPPASTEPPPRRRRLLPLALLLLAIALATAAAFTPDVRTYARQLLATPAPRAAATPENLTLTPGPFAAYLRLEAIAIDADHTLTLRIDRTADYPATPEDLDTLANAAPLDTRLTAHALAIGYLRIEMLNADHEHLQTHSLRIRNLQHDNATTHHIPLPSDTTHLTLTW